MYDLKEENKLLIAKAEDKLNFCNEKNKITFTDFVQLNEKSILLKFIKENRIQNFFFFGGRENSDREILVFYPDKINKELALKSMSNFIKVVKIRFKKENSMTHSEYLSGIMKLGIAREKFGDIIVNKNGADIIAFKEMAEYFKNNLVYLTRFRNSEISIVNLNEFENMKTEFKEFKIIISSCRLDNFVSELSNCSRSIAEEYIKNGKVFVNGINEYKISKKINQNDVITIRGKGKFIADGFLGETKNGRLKIAIKQYI